MTDILESMRRIFVPIHKEGYPFILIALIATILLAWLWSPLGWIGTILTVPGIREALRETPAPVVGVSPIIGGAPVRGMADACLQAIGVPTTAAAVGGLYADFLDGWLVDRADEGAVVDGVEVRSRPLLMTDVPATAAIASAALDLADELRQRAVRR